MAGPKGKNNLRTNSGKLLSRSLTQRKYFYIDGTLYKILRADRPNDIVRAWCFEDNKIVVFIYSTLKKQMQQAFDTEEVCTLLNRTKQNLIKHIKQGAINPPYKIGEQHNGFGYYKWSEDDVLALHEHYLTVGSGRPRKDGTLTAAVRIPSRMELVAMMKQQKMYYVQDASGNFVPVFEQPDWT